MREPWAELIARGEKTIEVRRQNTRHRGPLLIVSCRQPNVWDTGCAIAVVDLVNCRPMTLADEGAGLREFQSGHKAWVLETPRRVKDRVPIKEQQGLYNVDLSSGCLL